MAEPVNLRRELSRQGSGSMQSLDMTVLAQSSLSQSNSVTNRVSDMFSGFFTVASNTNRKNLDNVIPFGAVIRFTTHSVEPNVLKPWKVDDPRTSTGTGFFLGNGKIITNRHVIANSTSIRLERHGKPGNFTGRLLCESELCDLALLTCDDDTFWEGLPTIQLQETMPGLDDTVVAVGYPLGAKSVTVTRGVVSNVALKDLTLDGMNPRQVSVQIDAAINPGNSGGPVFNATTNQVVGVAFAGLQSVEGHGFIIPVSVVNLFIDMYERTKNKNFGLLPELGIDTRDLVNPSMRKSCFGGQLPRHHDGCLITAVGAHTPASAKLKVGDVLFKIDGVTVSEKGDVEFRGEERLPWEYLITKKPIGESVKLTVLRRSAPASGEDCAANFSLQEVVLEIKLASVPRLVPSILGIDYVSTYVIVGGLVILPAGMPLHEAACRAKKWGVSAAASRALSCCEFTDIQQQACILSDVLAHPINVCYNEFIGDIIDKINAVEILNMKHLVEVVSGVQSGELTIDFKVKDKSNSRLYVVFDAEEERSCREDILNHNKIPQWCSPSLL